MVWDGRVWDELDLAEKLDRFAEELFHIFDVETNAYEMRWAIYYRFLTAKERAKEARALLAKAKYEEMR